MGKSYESVMKGFMNNVPEGMDVREGTLAHIIASTTAMAAVNMYDLIDAYKSDCYVESAAGLALDKLCKIAGIERRGKTNAVVKIEGGAGLRVGDVVSGEELSYTISTVEDGYFTATANQSGAVGNSYTGEVVAQGRSDIEDAIKVVDIIAKGEDEEDDEGLRKRFIERANCPVCPGNVSYYKELVDSVAGIGGRRIVPTPEGAGTVKVIITDAEYSVANDELLNYVKKILDPEDAEGLGYGMAPLGHKIIVESVEKVDVNVQVEVSGGTTQAYYIRLANSGLPLVFKALNKDWDKGERLVLWDRVIEDYFFSIGAEDVNVISMNGNRNRLILEPNQILGDVIVNGA